MKENNKGFAISGVLYTLLLLFMMLIVMLMSNLQNRKTVLDKLKNETVSAIDLENRIDALEKRVTILEDPKHAFLMSHPVNSIYITIDPNESTAAKMQSKYGGSWVAYATGRTLIGLGSNGVTNYATVGATGGNEYIDINHYHDMNIILNYSFYSGAVGTKRNTIRSADKSYGSNTYKAVELVEYAPPTLYAELRNSHSTSEMHSSDSTKYIMNPYVVVYMYRRTA